MSDNTLNMAASYLASELERLMALPLETQSDLKHWYSEVNNVEQTLRVKYPDFEPDHEFWHFRDDADIRSQDSGYRDYQHKRILQYINRLRDQSSN